MKKFCNRTPNCTGTEKIPEWYKRSASKNQLKLDGMTSFASALASSWWRDFGWNRLVPYSHLAHETWDVMGASSFQRFFPGFSPCLDEHGPNKKHEIRMGQAMKHRPMGRAPPGFVDPRSGSEIPARTWERPWCARQSLPHAPPTSKTSELWVLGSKSLLPSWVTYIYIYMCIHILLYVYVYVLLHDVFFYLTRTPDHDHLQVCISGGTKVAAGELVDTFALGQTDHLKDQCLKQTPSSPTYIYIYIIMQFIYIYNYVVYIYIYIY